MSGLSPLPQANASPCTSAKSPKPMTSAPGFASGLPMAPRSARTSGLSAAQSVMSSRPLRVRISCSSRSFDSGFDGTGTYRLNMVKTQGPITVSGGDQGGPLTNRGIHTGEIVQGEIDVWTFTATAGERIAVHIGEITDTDDFRPWIRLWAPMAPSLGSASGLDAAEIGDVVAPTTGTYSSSSAASTAALTVPAHTT